MLWVATRQTLDRARERGAMLEWCLVQAVEQHPHTRAVIEDVIDLEGSSVEHVSVFEPCTQEQSWLSDDLAQVA